MSKELEFTLKLRKKLNKINEIYDNTKEMENALLRGDMVLLDMLVDMRTDLMFEVEGIDNEMEVFLENLTVSEKDNINTAMSKNSLDDDLQNDDLKKICEIRLQIRRVLKNIIDLDSMINSKIGLSAEGRV